MKTQLTANKPVHLDITFKPGMWIDPAKFIKQIAEAGYAARKDDIRLTLIGKIAKEGDKLFLTMEDVKPGSQKFYLVQSASKNEIDAKAWADAFQEVNNKVGETVELEGFWKPADTKKDKEALPTLSVIQVSLAKTGDKEKK